MRAPRRDNAELLNALRDLRRSAAVTVELADTVILGPRNDRAEAIERLPDALCLLSRRVARAWEALKQEREGQP